MKNKTCKKCKEEKLISEFYKKGKYYREICKICSLKSYKEAGKKWNKNHREYFIESSKKYRKQNKDKISQYRYKYNRENKDIQANFMRQYRLDINHKISDNLRSRIYIAIKKNSKIDHTIRLLGCSIEELKVHLENQFQKEMLWDNYGKWHIDHIKPCCSFDLSKEEEQYKCFHYTNLQPLWAEDNLRKSNKDKLLKK